MILNEIFEFLPKSKHSASYGSEKGFFPFLTSSNKTDKFVDVFDYDGEFLIIGDGGTGNCKYYNGKFSVSDHNYVLKPLNNCNAKCVSYFLQKNDYEILNRGFKGVGIKNIAKSYIEQINYSYNRSFDEKEIVDNLEFLNSLIKKEEKNIFLYDELIKSRFIGQEVA